MNGLSRQSQNCCFEDLPDFCSAEAVLRVFPVSRSSLYRLSAQGVIPCLRIGRRIVFSKERLKSWAEQAMKGDADT